MLIMLNEWYYHNSQCGYQTRPLAINVDEISEIHETNDPYHNIDGCFISLKNGKYYNVKEGFLDVMNRIQMIADMRGEQDE